MLPADLHSIVTLASYIVLSVTFVSAMGVFTLKVLHRANAPLRHTVALSFLVGLFLLPLMVALYPSSAVQSHSIASARRVLNVPVDARPSQAKPVEASRAGRTQENTTSGLFYPMLATLAAVWLVGAVVLTVSRVIKTYRQREYLLRISCVSNASILEMVERLRREMGIDRNVMVLESRHTPWPFTVGIVRPQIILPTDLVNDAQSHRLYATIVHELAHVSRLDYAVVMFEGFVRTVFWWNPFIYRLVTDLDVAREEICDSFVFNHDGDGQSLAEYLVLSMEHVASSRISAWGVGMSANEPHNVESRINRLIHGDKQMTYLSRITRGFIFSCLLMFCLACVHTNYAQAKFIIGTPVNFGPILNTEDNELHPIFSNDGLTLYFSSSRPGATGNGDIYTSSRISLESAWSSPEHFAPANTSLADNHPFISDDGLTFLSNSQVSGGRAIIYGLSRDTIDDPWGPRFALPAPINDGGYRAAYPFMSPDGLTLLLGPPGPVAWVMTFGKLYGHP